MGKGCYYCHGHGHIRKDCPRRLEFIQTQQQSQSQQQSVTVDRPARQSQTGARGSWGRFRARGDRTQGRVFANTREEAQAAPNMVASTLLLNHLPVFVPFDSGATHSFIAYKTIEKLGMSPHRVFMGFAISTPLRERVNVDIVYKDVKLVIMGCELSANLIPLLLHDFDINNGMDWLDRHITQMDCFAKNNYLLWTYG